MVVTLQLSHFNAASVHDPPIHSVMGLHDRYKAMAEGNFSYSYYRFSDGHGTESAVKWLEVIQPVRCQVQS
jgi:hypothetical protein